MLVYKNLREPDPNRPVSVKWGRDVVDATKAYRPIAGKGIRLTTTNHGTIIDCVAVGGRGGASASDVDLAPIPCRVTGGSALEGYDVDLYADGLALPKTGTGTLMVMQFNTNTNLPVGTVIMGYQIRSFVVGGTEQLN